MEQGRKTAFAIEEAIISAAKIGMADVAGRLRDTLALLKDSQSRLPAMARDSAG